TVAGLIWENWHHGRKKALWISVGSDLKFDARRDLDDMGASCIEGKFFASTNLDLGNGTSLEIGTMSL
ncbi:strawberry notch-like protein, partial [Trifolium medium]|nr:strawberry notch-like protein [Trifolium medium]